MLAASKMNSSTRKYSLILILIFSFSISYSQDFIDKVVDFSKSELHKDYQAEFSIEMRDVFEKISIITDQNLSFNNCDSLFIIRGLDIQNRTAYGRIWNDKFRFDYIGLKKWNEGKIMKSDAEVSASGEKCYTEDFNTLIRLIEKGDYKSITEISEKHAALSGVSWTIIRFYKGHDKVKYDYCEIQDFAILDND